MTSEEKEKKVLALFKKNYSPTDICKLAHINRTSYYQIVKKHNLPSKRKKKPISNNIIPGIIQSTIQSPTTQSTNIKSTKPEIIMMKLAQQGNFNAAKYVLENPIVFDKKKELPHWHRPPILAPKQHTIIDAITDHSTRLVVVVGDRRTGKTTAGWIGVNENVWNGTRTKWGFWGATEDSCIKLHNDMYFDPITFNETIDLSVGHSSERTRFFNGGLFETHATRMSDSSGLQYQGIWIDETHQVIKDNPDVLAIIAGIIRSEPDLKIVMTMNTGGASFQLFVDELLENKAISHLIKYFTLTKDDVTHITQEGDELSRALMVASAGEQFAAQQLDNIRDLTLDVFPTHMIKRAYDTYADWMYDNGIMDEFLAFNPDKLPRKIIISVDPGFGHATGIFVLGSHSGHYFEINSWMMYGDQVSEDRIKAKVVQEYRFWERKGVRDIFVLSESSSGGLFWIKSWKDQGLTTRKNNYTSKDEHPESRESQCRVMKQLLEEERFHFQSTELRTQLRDYDLSKVDDKHKGDLADAAIHGVFTAQKKGIKISFVK